MSTSQRLGACALVIAGAAGAATVSNQDSTQPRGAPLGLVNAHGQSLDPITDGFRAPARFGAVAGEEGQTIYDAWAGSIMAWSMRDPSFFAALNVANQDFINYLNSLPGAVNDPGTPLGQTLRTLGLADDVTKVGGRLQPEHLLPVAADLCLRCHTPGGWLEGRSEPPSNGSSFLKGDFWGASFLEQPLDGSLNPRPVNLAVESEAEMEGVQCDTCHRNTQGFTRQSRFDGSTMAAGNGGFFVSKQNPFGANGTPDDEFKFQNKGEFCGTCHEVTNPLITTRTAGAPPDMLHPIERTYTEWYWSGLRTTKDCQSCHAPMQFLGAHTWLLKEMGTIWGDVDQKWVDKGYPVDATRTVELEAGIRRNRTFMARRAARVTLDSPPPAVRPGDLVNLDVRVTNLTGHKLPTGYAEGRRAWLYVKVTDSRGTLVFEDGTLAPDGTLTATKVYEHEAVTEGYSGAGLPADGDHFHFILLNKIVKDNRIPPAGYKKAAYQADGALIVPENLYADGQNWDVTRFTFPVPAKVSGRLRVQAVLKYQTFSHEYVEFLRDHDNEKTVAAGGRARNIPFSPEYAGLQHWGEVLDRAFVRGNNGAPVDMGSGRWDITVAQ
jgi:hypothetical protein